MDAQDRERQLALMAARAGEPLWPAGQEPDPRLENMRPRQFVALREACPVLYVPLGSIEWHGQHMPLGADGIKSHELCIRVARRVGGVVHPPLFWGTDIWWKSATGEIRRGMDAIAGFRLPGSIYQLDEMSFLAMIRDIIAEGLNAGFGLIVLYAGHCPSILLSLVHKAAGEANRQAGRTVAYPIDDADLAEDIPQCPGHAGTWETALLMALRPDLVDLEELPRLPEPLVAMTRGDPRLEATRELGERWVDLIVDRLSAAVMRLLPSTDSL